MNFAKLVIHVPSLSMFGTNSVHDILSRAHTFDNPLLCLLSCRWFEASKHSGFPFCQRVESIGLPEDPSVVVVSDYAATYDSTFDEPVESIRAAGNLVVPFSCVVDSVQPFLCGALNAFDYPKFKRVQGNGFYEVGTQATHENGDIITVPIGCGSSWLPEVSLDRGKVILLDEVHGSVIDSFEDSGRFDVLAYNHSLKVCEVLAKKGYRILTFCRESRGFIDHIKTRYPFLETIDWQGWMPFTEMARHYASAPLFFSHFHEAHGYPIYENLQLGNAVIGYVENINQHVVRQFQNGTLLSSTMPPAVAADMIDAYFERYQRDSLQNVIADDAHRRFSCDTFVSRLVHALEKKNIVFCD